MVETINRRERRFILLFALFLVLITSLPYAAAFEAAGEDWAFTGFLIGVEDGNSYLAKMLRGAYGEWLFRTPYTTLEQPGVLTFFPYLLLGKLAAGSALHRQLVGIFHLFRTAGIVLTVYGSYRFSSIYLDSQQTRRWATIIATAGAGLGWLALPWIGTDSWELLPLSFISPETFGFLANLAVPHLAVARGLFLLCLSFIIRDMTSSQYSWATPILVLAVFLFNPLAGVSMILVLSAFHLAHLGAASAAGRWTQWIRTASSSLWASSLSIPYVIYLGISFRQQAFLQGWAEQNLILSPHAGYYALAYGALAVPGVFGLGKLLRDERPAGLMLASWLLVLPALPYLPVGVQRRLPEAGWLALAIAAALGMDRIRSYSWRRSAYGALLITALVAPALLLWGAWQTALEPAQPAFVPSSSERAYQIIADRAVFDDVVIANFRNSNALPAWAPVRVPIGHGPESINGEELRREVQQFFASDQQAERKEFLRRIGADWLLIDVEDGPGFPGEEPWQLVSEFDGILIYQVMLHP